MGLDRHFQYPVVVKCVSIDGGLPNEVHPTTPKSKVALAQDCTEVPATYFNTLFAMRSC